MDLAKIIAEGCQIIIVLLVLLNSTCVEELQYIVNLVIPVFGPES